MTTYSKVPFWTVYHSREWELAVEAGFITARVDWQWGEHKAFMVPASSKEGY